MKKFIIPAIICFFILFSLVSTFYEWNAQGRTKPIRYFELVHNFPTDYNFYLSRIRQGKEGAWLAREKYTSEPHDPSFVQVLYVFIGRVSDWVHVQTPYVWFSYHVMRVFFGILLLLVTWKLVQWFFDVIENTQYPISNIQQGTKNLNKNSSFNVGHWLLSIEYWKLLTFLLAVTASTWPKFESVDGWPRFGGFMPWYSVIDSLQRITFIPHVLFGQALLVFILWVFAGGFLSGISKVNDSRNWGSFNSGNRSRLIHPGNWVFLGVVGIAEGIVFPPGLLFIYAVLALGSIIELLQVFLVGREKVRHIFLHWFVDRMSGRIIFSLLTAPTFIYYSLLLTQYPWRRLVEFDVLHPTQFSYIEYFLAVGPVLLIGLVGVFWVVIEQVSSIVVQKEKALFSSTSNMLIMLVSWVVTWLGLLFIFNFIPQQSPTRFTQMFPHVPLAILGCYFFFSLGRALSNLGARNRFPFNIHHSSLVIPILIILLALGSMFSSWLWQKDFIDHKLRADYPAVPHGAEVMYPLKSIIDGLSWLQVYTPRDAVVLSGVTTGNYIPVYAGNTAYIGHANTVNAEAKGAVVANFYRNRLGGKVEMAWVKEQGISYIFYGPEEMDIAGGLSDLRRHYPALETVYKEDSVTIYKVP